MLTANGANDASSPLDSNVSNVTMHASLLLLGRFRGRRVLRPVSGVADGVNLGQRKRSSGRVHPVATLACALPRLLARQVLRPERPRAALERTNRVHRA